jgi:RNA polymerase sigma factor for flagellar operon FliA
MAKSRATSTTKSAAKPEGKKAAAKPAAKSRRYGEPAVPSPYDKREILDVWVEFKRTNCEKIRNYFMERYLPLVRYNAERVHSKLPDEVDVDDLKQAGIFGLMDAINAFSLDRGVKFETYCAPRIRGAILDELRAMDWVPRLVRSRTSKVEKARKRLEMAQGRKPTEQEIASELDVDMDEYRKMAKDAGPTGVVSLNRKWYETDSNKDVREIDVLKDERQVNPLSAVQKRDLKDMLTKGLSRAERLIVILYYYEEMTMKEIGLTLDLSESRVSQMHSSILARLRAQVRTHSKELESEE